MRQYVRSIFYTVETAILALSKKKKVRAAG